MGIYDRDYYRDDTPTSGWFAGDHAACKFLIAINIAVYLLQVMTRTPGNAGGPGLTEWLGLSAPLIIQEWQVWRLLTYGVCHDVGSPMHILFNMLCLWWFGGVLEATYYGSREFLKFYLTSIVFSGLVSVVLELATGQRTFVIGASGGVLAAMTVFAFHQPHHKILLFFVIPVEIRWLVIGYAVFNLHPILLQLAGQNVPSDVAHAAHSGGLLYGYLYKRFGFQIGWLPSFRLPKKIAWPSMRSKPNIRLYDPPGNDAELDQRVDEVLAKISSQGESSLSDNERELLKDASRRYKNR